MSSDCADQLDLFSSANSPCEKSETSTNNDDESVARRAESENSAPSGLNKRPNKKATRKRSDGETGSSDETQNNQAPREPDRQPFLSDQDVAKRYSVSRTTIWRWLQNEESFPAPIRLAQGTTRWTLAELEAYERNRAKKSSADGCRQSERQS